MSAQFQLEESMASELENTTEARRPKHPPLIKKHAFQLHRYIGLVAGLYLTTMSLSGTTLVFHDEIQAWLCPETPPIQGTKRASLDLIFSNCRKQFPQFTFSNLIADPENHPTLVFGSDSSGHKITCETNPFTGDFIQIRNENQVLKFISDLHFNLLNGGNGRTANGIGALLLLTLSVTGLLVWWRGFAPAKSTLHLLPAKSKISAKTRVNVILTRNLHAAVGVCCAPFLLTWSISGFYFGFPSFAERAVNLVLPVSSQRKSDEDSIGNASQNSGPNVLTADLIVQNAKDAAPEFDFVSRISMPDKKKKNIRVWLLKTRTNKGEAKEKENCQVFLDPHSGSVLAVSRSEKTPAGDLFLQTLTKLHFGSIGGTTTKCLWVLAGLTPALMSITGLMIFIQKSRSKKRLKRNQKLHI
ncbi:MAG: PepSY domain-containing protein [Candidatus Obscuribacterales bacterium]|jgi:uncharacterized iron-regulated membrane protein|nr:PepSY domain-containing protein [Candidatus Obscuribacterales bacterium]